MTLEEMQQLLEEQKKTIEELAKRNETLEKNQKEQNSYITKLETQLQGFKSSSAQPGNPVSPQLSQPLTSYLQKNMKKDTIEEALALIAQQGTGADVIDCIKPELMKFLEETMTIDRTKVSYVTDAFHLIYGKAMSNKDHAIHKLGQAGTKENKPPVSQPASQVAGQQDIAQQLRDRIVPTMTPADVNAAQTPPLQNPNEQIKTTKDAVNSFKRRIINAGGNRFS
jgi:hypothetical protein